MSENTIKEIASSKPVKTATSWVVAGGLLAAAGIIAYNKIFPDDEKKIKNAIKEYTVNVTKANVRSIDILKLKAILRTYPTYLKSFGIYTGLSNLVQIADQKNENRVYWNPAPLAEKIYTKQKGVNWSDNVLNYFTNGLWSMSVQQTTGYPELLNLNIDETRLLHNYWLQKHSEGKRLYDWVSGESDVDGLKTQVINHLNRAGVGMNVKKKL